MATLDLLKKARLDKLNKIRELGIDPYPSKVDRADKIYDASKKSGKKVSVAGRIIAIRGQGKISFADIYDGSGKIQCVFKSDILDKNSQKIISLIDIGDFISVGGKVDKTQSGEISVFADKFKIITKTVLPLPDKWYGLKDIEDRYRKRYLDTILNPEVKNRLETRSKIIQVIREFLNARGFLEVETPTLQPVYGGGFAKPFKTRHEALDANFYLRISDEMYLKRLIVGSFEKVYEITKVFRNEGFDRDHNPEFTMFEAQIAYEDYTYGMDIIEEIFEYVAKKVLGSTKFKYQEIEMDVKRPWQRLTMVGAIKKYAGLDPVKWKTAEEARKIISKQKIDPKKLSEANKILSLGELIAFTFEELVEEKLIQPTIIYDYPIEVSPLAKKCLDPRFTQRFEMFAFGSELGNNYTELNDPIDLNKRFIEEKKREEAGFDEAHQTDYDYLEAIEHGFPPTCGIAIGIDRFVMLLTDAKNIKEVIPFPTLRSEREIKKQDVKTHNEKLNFTRKQAWDLLTKHLKNQNLIRHCLSVESVMRALAKHFKEYEELWGIVGLLHDGDYEETKESPKEHTLKMADWIKKEGVTDERILNAILSHNYAHTGQNLPQNNLEWSLYCCDELTGLIVAVALVKGRKLENVSVEGVLKKFPEKNFAAGVNRDQISMCKEKLKIDLPDFISIALVAMKSISKDLSLD